MDWLCEYFEVKIICVVVVDLNGMVCGKCVLVCFVDKILIEGMKFLFLVLNMDIWGEDVEDSLLVFQFGDFDGLLLLMECGFMLMFWLEVLIGLLLLWMFYFDGCLYEGDL